jgi:hypothetical protein
MKDPDPLGQGMRIREVQAPGPMPPASPNANATLTVTSAVVTAIDTFDETMDGKSRGTIYLQDEDQALPLSGVSTFSPTFQPSNLRLFPGDVVDIHGQYVELKKLGTTVDFGTNFLPQFDKPNILFRTETTKLPAPAMIPIEDLFAFPTGRKWIGMLVTATNVTVESATSSKGRVTYLIDPPATCPPTQCPLGGAPAIDNELYNLDAMAYGTGTTFKSVTGIVTFFFNLKIAPRSPADLVQ